MFKFLSKLIIAILLFEAYLTIVPAKVFAAANFYLSPANKSVAQGTTLSVAVRVSSGEAIDSVQANLSYPADKFDFLSISAAGSAFSVEWQNNGGGGSVKIARSVPGGVSGDKLIATANFRAKVGSGSAAINFAAGTEADSAGNPVAGGQAGGNYTFAPPPPPPPPPDTTAPKISDVKVTATSFKGATIEWKTDEAASSIVEYGLTTKYGLSAEGPGNTKDHKVTFSSDLLIPGETYHFRVKSLDGPGNQALGSDTTFRAKGYSVQIKVLDQKGKIVSGAKVTLGSEPQTATTDKKGIATFTDVAPGKHLVAVDFAQKLQTTTITVKDATDEEISAGKVKTQSFDFKVAGTASQLYFRYAVAAATGLLVILIGGGGLLWWRKVKKISTPD